MKTRMPGPSAANRAGRRQRAAAERGRGRQGRHDNSAGAALQTGLQALRGGNGREAVELLARAVRGGFRQAWLPLAHAHLGLGDLRRGEQYCRRALHHGAGIEACNLLAALRLNRDEYHGAERAARQALGLRSDDPAARMHLAQALLGQRRAEEAVPLARALSREHPDNVQLTRLLARACRETGRVDEAIAVLESGLARRPADPGLLYDLTLVKSSRADDASFDQAHRALAQAGADDLRAMAHFALARMHERGDDHARAFDAYRAGNACVERDLLRSGQAFDRQRHAAMIAAVMARFGADDRSGRTGPGLTRERPPIVLAGVSRSGKTLLAGLLGRHRELVNLDEDPILGRLAARFGPSLLGAPDAGAAEIAERFALAWEGYLGHYTTAGEAGMNTHPLNFRILGLLAIAMPGTRVIHVERDETDLLLANYVTYHNNPSCAYSCNLADCLSYIRDYARLMAHWRRTLPLAFHGVRYEALVNDPDRVIAGVLEFLGLPWDAACGANRDDDADAVLLTPGLSLSSRTRLDPSLVGYGRRFSGYLPAEIVRQLSP